MKKGNVKGYVQKPIYIEDELIKTIDVNVSELIKSKPNQGPITVLKSIHDILQNKFDDLSNELTIRTGERDDALSELELLISEIAVLEQTVDSVEILRTVADNQLDESNDRYQILLGDFQISVQRGIQEAVERVSLEAQISGLTAQLISVRDQLSGAQAESTAAASGLSPDITGDMYSKFISNEDSNNFIWTTARTNPTPNKFGKVDIQNLREGEFFIKTLKLIVTYDNKLKQKKTDPRHLSNHGPIGFNHAKIPSTTKTVNIKQGEKVSIPIYGGSELGGNEKGTVEPDGWLSKDRTYQGTIKVITTFDDDEIRESDVINWTIIKT